MRSNAEALLSRRSVIAGVVLTAAGCSGATAGPAASGPPAPRLAPGGLASSWRGRPDGPLPSTGDEGQPWLVRLSGTSTRPQVRGGALDAALPDALSAAYLDQSLPTPVRTIGARFGFGPGSADGAICLAAWRDFALAPDPAYTTGCHLVVAPDRWTYGVAEHGHLELLDGGRLVPEVLRDGTSVGVEVTLTGSRATVRLPRGAIVTVTDPRVDALSGRWACWEFYKNAPGASDVRLYRTWAAP